MSPFPYFKTAFMTSIGNHWRSRHQKNNKKNRMPQLLIKSWYNCLITIHGLQTIRRKRLKYFSDLRHKWGFSCLFHSFFFPPRTLTGSILLNWHCSRLPLFSNIIQPSLSDHGIHLSIRNGLNVISTPNASITFKMKKTILSPIFQHKFWSYSVSKIVRIK